MSSTEAHRRHVANILACLRPAPSLLPSKWSGQHRVLSPEGADRPGKLVLFPMQVEPMDATVDPDVGEVVMMWAAQTSKSETFNCVTGYFMHADPSPILFVQPTVDLAEAYSVDRIAPMIRDSDALRGLVRDPRTRDSGNKILAKSFPGGSLVLLGANSPAGLAGRPRKIILQDEVDRYPASAGTEGDPGALADKRAESFPDAVKMKASTPTIKGLSKIEKLMAGSDYRKWHCACPRCHGEQVWMWEQVKWPKDKPEEAFLECRNCKAQLTDAERVQSVRGGRWKATQPFTGVRGFWLNGLNTLFRCHRGFRNRLHEMAVDFLKAKAGGRETLRVWTNTFLAECFEEEVEKIDATEIPGRDEEYEIEPLPEGVLLVTVGGDVQADRIEAEFVGWGRDEERWGLGKVILNGDPTKDDSLWDRFGTLLKTEFTSAGEAKLGAVRSLVDMGFANQRVLQFCAPRLIDGVYACRGINRVGPVVPPLLPAKPSRNNRARIPHWNIGVTVAKQTMYDRLLLITPGPRFMHFPKDNGYDDDHFAQLTSEKKKRRYASGVGYDIFEKDSAAVRNEAIDLWVYAYAALQTMYPLSWDALEIELKRKEEAAQSVKKSQGQPVRQVIRRGSWATRY